MIESELLSIRIFLVKFTLTIGREKYFLLILFGKTKPWTFKGKDLNGEKNNKKLLWKRIVVEYVINGLLFRTRESY